MDYPQYEKLEQVAYEIDDAAKLRSRQRVRSRLQSLCGSCHSAMIYRTDRMNDPIVICQTTDPEQQMPLDIVECSRYSAIGAISLTTLASIATLLDPDKKGTAGFTIPTLGKEK